MSRDHGWICVTNDKRLRLACVEDGVEVYWGLELMTKLVRMGELEADDAIEVALKIQAQNPHHITDDLIERLRHKVGR